MLEFKNECSLCGVETTEAEGAMFFYIGILPYTMCPICWSGMSEAFECHEPCYKCGCETPHDEDMID